MGKMNVRAAVSRDASAGFSVEEISIDSPRDDEVLVKIAGVGLCHSDLLAHDGTIAVPLPAVFGHEGAGEIVAVGTAVRSRKIGDRVVLSFNSCGSCHQCHNDDPAYCCSFGMLNYAGGRPDGSKALHSGEEVISSHFFGQSSFASHALCSERNSIVVPDNVPISLMGPLGCGIQTGAGAIMNTMACRPGSSLLIIGGGSLGLSAVLGAVVQECETIIVAEPHETRRLLAMQLGATHVINPIHDDMVAALRMICPQGVQYIFDSTGLPQVGSAALSCLGMRGTMVVAGIPADPQSVIAVPMLPMVGMGQTVKGVVEGDSVPEIFIPRLVALYQEGRFPFDKLITRYPFNSINEAVRDHHAGKCVKAVLLPDS